MSTGKWKNKLSYLETKIRKRAAYLAYSYKQSDLNQGREKGDLTAKWIRDNIISKPCAHCGKTGWDVIGCNRLDNSKPHTKDNVEPCCFECNYTLAAKELRKQVYQYTLDGELVKVWESAAEAGRNGYSANCISSCCNGHKYRHTHKGYRWSYEPL